MPEACYNLPLLSSLSLSPVKMGRVYHTLRNCAVRPVVALFPLSPLFSLSVFVSGSVLDEPVSPTTDTATYETNDPPSTTTSYNTQH